MTITITRYRGDTVADSFTVKDSSGAAVNITGYTFKLTVDSRQAPEDETTKLFHMDGVLVTPSAGVVKFAPTEIQADQTPGNYYFDIEMVDGAGGIQTLAVGKYKFVQDISK